jgi:hypothetical protein
MRPDRCGAIVRWRSRWRGWETVTIVPVGEKVPEETLARLIDYAKERSLPVIFIEHRFEEREYRTSRQLATGPAEFIAAAKHGLNKDDLWAI